MPVVGLVLSPPELLLQFPPAVSPLHLGAGAVGGGRLDDGPRLEHPRVSADEAGGTLEVDVPYVDHPVRRTLTGERLAR